MLTVALPKGRMLNSLTTLFQRAGVDVGPIEAGDRRLLLSGERARILICRAADVPTFVEYGAADVGVAGKDVLWETGHDVAELLDLQLGRCEMIVAVPGSSGIAHVTQLGFNSRVATKYPRVAARYFREQGIQVDVIPLHGNIELAPLVGLADAVVDLTETGRTLRENDLTPIASIGVSTARLIANRVRYKLNYERIEALVSALRDAMESGG